MAQEVKTDDWVRLGVRTMADGSIYSLNAGIYLWRYLYKL